jgi:hypothetical protein
MSRQKTRYAAVGASIATMILAAASPALAQTAEAATTETQYIFNTLSFLMHGFLVMWMAAGFAMLESGLVRSKNTATICLKNIALYSVAGIMYYVVGYNLMYSGVDGGYIGSFLPWAADNADALAGNFEAGYAAESDWFFQMVFVATTASIVSGTVAERIKLWPFLLFTVFLTAIIYPIQGSWQWGGGWLSEMGFADFAGSTLVHSCGGWAALTGAIILGARKGKYAVGDHRDLHSLARLVRIQRRITIGDGIGSRRDRHLDDLRKHEPGRRRWYHCRHGVDPNALQEGRSQLGIEWSNRRFGQHHRGSGHTLPADGDHDRRRWRHPRGHHRASTRQTENR